MPDRRHTMTSLFAAPRALIGMIHVGALPGTPAAAAPLERIVEQAVEEARVYHDAGFTALMIENMHDRPYLNRAVGPEIVAAMSVVGGAIRREVALPLGVQVLAGANRESLAVAHACGGTFVRVEGFVYAHVADEGIIESDAGALLRYRKAIGAEGVAVFADIKKKHSSHALTSDVDLAETARAAEFFLADGVVVTGTSTGRPTDLDDVHVVHEAVAVPVFVGSGLDPANIAHFVDADGFIVGSSVKHEGTWSNALDPARARAVARAFAELPAAR